MIIGLSGYARSGKDEVANILVKNFGFKRVAFADPIRSLLLRVNPILENGKRVNEMVKEFGWNLTKAQSETRRLLQEIGVAGREMFGDDVWIKAAFKDVNLYIDNVVVSDVRFRNEANFVITDQGRLWRVLREGVGPVNNHISETDLDDAYFNAYVPNNGTLEELEAYVTRLIGRDAHKII